MQIRAFRKEDADEVAQVIAETLRVSNSKDYPQEYIEYCIAEHSAEVLLKASEERHMYVACDGERIVGTGGIAGYWGSKTESILLTIFVLPKYQGKGIGRQIINTLEQQIRNTIENSFQSDKYDMSVRFKDWWREFKLKDCLTMFGMIVLVIVFGFGIHAIFNLL